MVGQTAKSNSGPARWAVHVEGLGFRRRDDVAEVVGDLDEDNEDDNAPSLAELKRVFAMALGYPDQRSERWVLRNVSFSAAPGSIIWLKGDGDKPATLLRILNGAIRPSEGRAHLSGRVSALLSPGANLWPDLSVLTNIRQTHEQLPGPAASLEAFEKAVLEFASLRKFLHLKASHLSAGMQLRLSLGLALCWQPDVILLGDVMAVGDIVFQMAIMQVFRAARDGGATIVLSTDRNGLVELIADKILDLGRADPILSTPQDYELTLRQVRLATFLKPAPTNWEKTPFSQVDARIANESPDSRLHVCIWPRVQQSSTLVFSCAGTEVFRTVSPAGLSETTAPDKPMVFELPLDVLKSGVYTISIGSADIDSRLHRVAALTLRRQPPSNGAPEPSGLLQYYVSP